MKFTKRQELPAGLWSGLWVVATPIGNLADLTERARLALGAADEILAEDTRRAAQLLSALGLPGDRVHRFDENTPVSKISFWAEELARGKNLALVSDAGTPGVSDPGAALCAQARSLGARIIPIPGVSAVTALVSISGVRQNSFCFKGFFPREIKEQKLELAKASVSEICRVFVWFESPQRILKSLKLISENYPSLEVVAAKELTKIYENVFYGSSVDVYQQVEAEIEKEGPLGEWSFLVSFAKRELEAEGQVSDATVEGEINYTNILEKIWPRVLVCLKKSGVTLPDAVSVVSQEFGISKKLVYAEALHVFEKKPRPGG
ncbi:MAG: rRNA small subunit methyltransferase 1 [Bdellovibrio sp.]|nr:rRNA small subunit methyltransferase 1 [Bdellovibrio sp.]